MWFISVWLTLKHVAKIIYKVCKRVNIKQKSYTSRVHTDQTPRVTPKSLNTLKKTHTNPSRPSRSCDPRENKSGNSLISQNVRLRREWSIKPVTALWKVKVRVKLLEHQTLRHRRNVSVCRVRTGPDPSDRSPSTTVGLPFLKSFRFHASELVLILSSWIKYKEKDWNSISLQNAL